LKRRKNIVIWLDMSGRTCNKEMADFTVEISDLYKIHEREEFKDLYQIFVVYKMANSIERMTIDKPVLIEIRDKINEVLKE